MSENQKSARKRGGNFLLEEECLLATLVNEQKYIVECKKQGGTTWQEKQNTWQKITNSFNSKSGKKFRDLDCLRNKWSQMKKSTKKRVSANKQERLKTGGGKPNIQNFSDADNIIMDILGEQIDGLEAKFDSDVQFDNVPVAPAEIAANRTISEQNFVFALENQENEELGECEEIMDLEIINGEINILEKPINENVRKPAEKDDHIQNMDLNEPGPSQAQDWSKYSTKMLKGRRNNKLQCKKQSLASKGLKLNEMLVQAKLDFVQLQREKFLIEHNLKMQILEKQLENEIKRAEKFKSTN